MLRSYITDKLIMKYSCYKSYVGIKKLESDAKIKLSIYGKDNLEGGEVEE